MACYKQLRAYKSPEGKISWPKLGSKASDHEALFPLRLNCGKCIGCRISNTKDWAVRSMHEAQMHPQNSFLTLTYSDEKLPDDRGLRVDHWQKFAKKVRNHCGPFRFLEVGEYSDAPEFRPHYHALIFGHDWHETRVKLQRKPWETPLFASSILEKLWPHGIHAIGELNYKTAAYVAGYCLKKLSGEYAERQWDRLDTETGEWWQVPPEHALMSRRPGLGTAWFEKYGDDVYPSDEVIVDGKQLRPPAFYDTLLKRKDERMFRELETKRRNSVREHAEDHTDERLKIREEIAERKLHIREKG